MQGIGYPAVFPAFIQIEAVRDPSIRKKKSYGFAGKKLTLYTTDVQIL